MFSYAADRVGYDRKIHAIRVVERASAEFRQRNRRKLLSDLIADPSPERRDSTIRRASAVDPVLGLTVAVRGRQKVLVERRNRVPDRDLLGVPCESISAGGPSSALDESGNAQLAHEFGGVDSRNAFSRGDQGDRNRCSRSTLEGHLQ